MDKETYKAKIIGIDDDCRTAKEAVYRRYAQSNNSVKEGDVIEDHQGKILVDHIRFSVSMSAYPVCIYNGKILKKNGDPAKSGKVRDVWQPNLLNLE